MKNKKIVCLGDSLTQGYQINEANRWTNLLQNEFAANIINCGISGDTTNGMLARCETVLLQYKPTHIIILGGTNDLWFGLKNEYILSNIHAMIRQASNYNAIPVVGIPTTILNNKERNFVKENYLERITNFQDMLEAYCLVDNQKTIPFYKNMNASHFLEDGLHPNEAGQIIIKNNVLSFFLN
ncbi:MAG: GDSL-type esterase/lipase family protein [Oceanihabitans sp.]